MTDLHQPWLEDACGRVDKFDPPIGDPARMIAVGLLHALSAYATVAPVHPPQVVPTPDGGVQIEWHEQGFDLELTVGPDGDIGGWLHGGWLHRGDGAETEW